MNMNSEHYTHRNSKIIKKLQMSSPCPLSYLSLPSIFSHSSPVLSPLPALSPLLSTPENDRTTWQSGRQGQQSLGLDQRKTRDTVFGLDTALLRW